MDVKLPQLKKGERGLQVSMLQSILNVKTEAETDLATDGIFGPKTDEAVRSWQQARQLDVDGIVGPLTWTDLLEYDEEQTIVRNI
jgi:peptidoglycan hydrolase-like protein with peptidoglycan-binding domain